ncbi:MAG: tRNA epoxyqueuosine(34) reductase QueG [Burkholderiaceae bacterium]
MPNLPALSDIRGWARELGFARCGVAGTDVGSAGEGLSRWLAAGFHGEMGYMARNVDKRTDPSALVPGALSAIMVAVDYRPRSAAWLEQAWDNLADTERANVSRYALGRDYHRVVRHRLQGLATRIEAVVGDFGYRAFCDSAPVMEVELAERAGLGWRGKHTLLIDARRGSMFFLGTLLTDLPLEPESSDGREHCGRCVRCIDICPTAAIVAPHRLDARRCISYLTIEHPGSIPLELRPAIGNRIYGCDDCQLVCPWNRFAVAHAIDDFEPRNGLDTAALSDLFAWSREEFETRTAGSPIRRIGHERWLRNIAVGLGNVGTASERTMAALVARMDHPSGLVREHTAWALARVRARAGRARRASGRVNRS